MLYPTFVRAEIARKILGISYGTLVKMGDSGIIQMIRVGTDQKGRGSRRYNVEDYLHRQGLKQFQASEASVPEDISDDEILEALRVQDNGNDPEDV